MAGRTNYHHRVLLLAVVGWCCLVTLGDNLFDVNMPGRYEDLEGELKSRSKRAIGFPTYSNLADANGPSAFQTSPADLDFELKAVGDNAALTNVERGRKRQYMLFVQLPASLTDELLVEVFAPDNATTVMKLCHPAILHKGSAVTYDDATAAPVMDAKDGTANMDRAVFNFSTVTTTAGPFSNGDNMIAIGWEAIMLDGAAVDSSNVRVSAGAEYNNQEMIWVAQDSFTADMSRALTPATPTGVSLSGPNEIPIGQSASFVLDLTLTDITNAVNVDVFAPLNETDVISICSLTVTSVGDAYNCYEEDLKKIEATLELSPSGITNDYARIELGTLLNARAFDGAPATVYQITLKFIAMMSDDPDLIGKVMYLGAAVEIGTTQIWAGQLNVLGAAKPTTLPQMSTAPAFRINIPGNYTGTPSVMIGQALNVEIEMDVPANSEANYILEANMPFAADNTPLFRVCKMYLKEGGRNVPCVTNRDPVFASSANSIRPEVNDRGQWEIGYIKNAAHVGAAVDPRASTMTLTVSIAPVNTTLNTGTQTLGVGVMFVPNQALWTGTVDVEVAAGSPFPSTPNYPTATMALDTFTADPYVGEARKFDITMQFTAGEIYGPSTLEVLTAVNDTALLSICKVEIAKVGKGLGCYDQKVQNESFVYTARAGDGKYDRVVMAMDAIESLARATDPAEDSQILVSIYAKLEDHDMTRTANDETWAGAGIVFPDNRIWVSSVTLNTAASARDAVTAPIFTFERHNSTSTDLEIGMPVVYDLFVKIVGKESTSLKVQADITSGDLTICFVRVVEFGSNFPCGDTDKEEVKTYAADDFTVTSAVLETGPVTNIGDGIPIDNGIFDEHTVHIQVGMQLKQSATAGPSSTFTVSAEYNAMNTPVAAANVAAMMPISLTHTPTPTLEVSNSTWPNVSMYVGELHENTSLTGSPDIARGESKLVRMDLDIGGMGPANMLEVKFLSPVNDSGQLQICDINVIHVGANMPCVSKKTFLDAKSVITRTNSEYMDIGSVNLGVVCYWPFKDEPEASRITIEGIVRLTRNNTLSEGDTVFVTGTAKVNGGQIYVQQFGLVVKDVYDGPIDNVTVQGIDMFFNITPEPTTILWQPGMFYELPFYVTVPAYVVAPAFLDVQLPVFGSAVATVHSIRFTWNGVNLGCLTHNEEFEYQPKPESTHNTTQHDRYVLDLGIIMNTAQTWRNGHENETIDDNTFGFIVEIQMADALENIDASNHDMSVGISAAEIVVVIISVTITVDRDPNSQPFYFLEVFYNDSIIYDAGNPVPVSGRLQHNNMTSRAEGQNVALAFYYPPTLEFNDASWSTNCTHSNISLTNASVLAGKIIWWETLYFTDICDFLFNLDITTYEVPEGTSSPMKATTPYEVCSSMYWRGVTAFPVGKLFCENMEHMDPLQEVTSSTSCTAVALGLQGSPCVVNPTQSSPSPDGTRAVQNGLIGLTATDWWHPGIRDASYSRHMQVDFGASVKVTQVQVEQGGPDLVTAFRLRYSDDGIAWADGATITIPTPAANVVADMAVPQSRFSKSVRFTIVTAQNDATGADITVRIAMDGCVPPAFALTCPPAPTVALIPLKDRCILKTATAIFVCDRDKDEEMRIKTFRALDGTPGEWMVLDPNVANVIGWDSATGEIFGVSGDGRSYVMSDDIGITWFSISNARMTEVQALTTYAVGQEVPYVGNVPGSLGGYATAPWTVTYAGIENPAGTVVFDWTGCCG